MLSETSHLALNFARLKCVVHEGTLQLLGVYPSDL